MQNAMLRLIVRMCLLAMSAQAEARDVSCGEMKAAVAQCPKSRVSIRRRFAYRPDGSTSCAPRRAEPFTHRRL